MRICTLPLKAFVDSQYPSWLTLGVPRTLRTDLERAYGSDLKGIPWNQPVDGLFDDGFTATVFCNHLTAALVSTHDPLLAFHGLAHHQRVADNGDEALRAMQMVLGVLPGELLQAHLFALATHDKGHVGASFFATAEPSRVPTDRVINWAEHPVETYTAKLVDEMMIHLECSLLSRLVANYTVVASAFGAAHPQHGPRLRLGNVKPRAIFGCHMRAVDVLPPAEHTMATNSETALTYLEIPALPRPTTWQEYLNGRDDFLEYVNRMFSQLDRSVTAWVRGRDHLYSLTNELGWRANLRSARENLQHISDESPLATVKSAVLRARLATLNVRLD